MKFLLFQLYGAMAAWGEPAVGEARHSSNRPSKSALVGLLAAACGIRRENEATLLHLSEECGFGVKLLFQGDVLLDFHTIQVPSGPKKEKYKTRREELLLASKLSTVLSRREYRTDFFAVVSVWKRCEASQFPLDALKENLLCPVFPLYLGRRSCPLALPLNPVVVEATSLRCAFDKYSPEDLFAGNRRAKIGRRAIVQYYWEPLENSGMNAQLRSVRCDYPESFVRRQFGDRTELYSVEGS